MTPRASRGAQRPRVAVPAAPKGRAIDVGGERWFRHTLHSLEWAPNLATQFREVMERLRAASGPTGSYWAALGWLLAESDREVRR